MFRSTRTKILFLFTCLICFIILLFSIFPTQSELRNKILNEQGYTIIKQSQSVSADFTFNPKWIPDKLGQHFNPHFVFFDNLNTKIFISDVYKRDDGVVFITIDCSSKYFRNSGEFVSAVVVHKTNGGLSYSSIGYRPIFSDPSSGQQFPINYGTGRGPNDMLTVFLTGTDVKKYLSKSVHIHINNLNLIIYKKS